MKKIKRERSPGDTISDFHCHSCHVRNMVINMENTKTIQEIEALCSAAKQASYSMMTAQLEKRNGALKKLAGILRDSSVQAEIIEKNAEDLKKAAENGVKESMIDRLLLNGERINAISDALIKIVGLPNPLGRSEGWTAVSGIRIERVRVPIGVIGIIYESRPNVTVDAAALCIKSGNVCILRGGKEAINSNLCLTKYIRQALEAAGLPSDAVCLISDTTRESSTILMRQNKYLDLLIPRGGPGLIRSVVENSTVPVIETGSGNCHIYVDESADTDMALEIILNAKSRPSVCNAVETVLIHEKVDGSFLPALYDKLRVINVRFRGDEAVCAAVREALPASEEDYYTEYLDFILALKIVGSTAEAVEHINKYGTKHSEAIITKSMKNADFFKANIDSAAIYVNTSTRFTDGEEFGFGAEIGISTSKLHARGPMGLGEMTTIKYLIESDGIIRK